MSNRTLEFIRNLLQNIEMNIQECFNFAKLSNVCLFRELYDIQQELIHTLDAYYTNISDVEINDDIQFHQQTEEAYYSVQSLLEYLYSSVQGVLNNIQEEYDM